MKKLLLVLAFAFFGQQAFSQMYIVVLDDGIVGNCSIDEITLSKTNHTGKYLVTIVNGKTYTTPQKRIVL